MSTNQKNIAEAIKHLQAATDALGVPLNSYVGRTTPVVPVLNRAAIDMSNAFFALKLVARVVELEAEPKGGGIYGSDQAAERPSA